VSRGIERSGFKDARTIATERRSDGRVRALSTGLDALQSAPITSGVLVADVALTTTPARIEHGLGRVPVGVFMVAGQTGAFDIVWSAHATNPARYLDIAASAGTPTVSVWVF
jgi:hypothetical protein